MTPRRGSRRSLAPLREVADEIVIALDHRMDLDRLGAYEPLADKLLRFEHTGEDLAPGWLHRQCTGDWVLLLAGDEVPSAELVRRCPSCAPTRTAPVLAPRRWLWPARALARRAALGGRLIKRLVRNEPACALRAGASGAWPVLPAGLRGGAGLPP